jgi:hypothetical protein
MSEDKGISEAFLDWKPNPPKAPVRNEPTFIDNVQTVVDATKDAFTDSDRQMDRAISDIDKAANQVSEFVRSHPVETINNIKDVVEVVAAVATLRSNPGAFKDRTVLDGVNYGLKQAAEDSAAKTTDLLLFSQHDDRPTEEQARASAYEVEGSYFSKDGGKTWWLLKALRTSLGFGGIIAALMAAIAALLAVATTQFCAGASTVREPDTFPVQSLPAFFGAGSNETPLDSRTSSDVQGSAASSTSAPSQPNSSPPPEWEARLQRERMQAIIENDSNRYNRLIQEHRKIYSQYGVNPCTSGFFPQGCTVAD